MLSESKWFYHELETPLVNLKLKRFCFVNLKLKWFCFNHTIALFYVLWTIQSLDIYSLDIPQLLGLFKSKYFLCKTEQMLFYLFDFFKPLLYHV